MLEPRQLAPEFSLPATSGIQVTLSALRSGPVVLFFYPRDNTAGCTKQAIGFSHLSPQFHAIGAQVFGISKDSLTKHNSFVAKQALTVTLLSDENNNICETYGVWVEKKMYGKTFMGIVRTTVLIDAQGHVARIWPKVKVEGHAAEVLDAVKALS